MMIQAAWKITFRLPEIYPKMIGAFFGTSSLLNVARILPQEMLTANDKDRKLAKLLKFFYNSKIGKCSGSLKKLFDCLKLIIN